MLPFRTPLASLDLFAISEVVLRVMLSPFLRVSQMVGLKKPVGEVWYMLTAKERKRRRYIPSFAY
jgi:hypothetical protein